MINKFYDRYDRYKLYTFIIRVPLEEEEEEDMHFLKN